MTTSPIDPAPAASSAKTPNRTTDLTRLDFCQLLIAVQAMFLLLFWLLNLGHALLPLLTSQTAPEAHASIRFFGFLFGVPVALSGLILIYSRSLATLLVSNDHSALPLTTDPFGKRQTFEMLVKLLSVGVGCYGLMSLANNLPAVMRAIEERESVPMYVIGEILSCFVSILLGGLLMRQSGWFADLAGYDLPLTETAAMPAGQIDPSTGETPTAV